MAQKPLTCAECGRPMQRAKNSAPQGKAVCRPCRSGEAVVTPIRPATVPKAVSRPAPRTAAPLKKDPKWGPVETSLRSDLSELGDLMGVEPTLSEMAIRLAKEIDLGGGEDGRQLSNLNRELRQTLSQLLKERAAEEDELTDLASPE